MGRHQSKPVVPTGDWVLSKGRVPSPLRKLQPDIREVPGLAAPASSAALPDSVTGSRSRRPRCCCRSPGARLQQGAGKGTLARSGNRGECGGAEPGGDTPSPAPGRSPLPRLPVAQPPPSPHLSPLAKLARDPHPGSAPTRSPSKPRALREVDSWGRGWRPQSPGGSSGDAGFSREKMGGGRAGQTLQTRKWGGGAIPLQAPGRCAHQNGEEGEGLQESLSGKSLAPWGLGGWRN